MALPEPLRVACGATRGLVLRVGAVGLGLALRGCGWRLELPPDKPDNFCALLLWPLLPQCACSMIVVVCWGHGDLLLIRCCAHVPAYIVLRGGEGLERRFVRSIRRVYQNTRACVLKHR